MPKCSFHMAWSPIILEERYFFNSSWRTFILNSTLFSRDRCLHRSIISLTLTSSSTSRQDPINTRRILNMQKNIYKFRVMQKLSNIICRVHKVTNKNLFFFCSSLISGIIRTYELYKIGILLLTLSQIDSLTICLSSYMAFSCKGWSFSGLYCPTDTILIRPPSPEIIGCCRIKCLK